uniref:Non-structural protein NS1 n=1 Tax=Mudumu virus TaxID=2841875 RepID=A0A8E8RB02_9REOV|nr:hydrophobic tubular protein [Mudumu virus]
MAKLLETFQLSEEEQSAIELFDVLKRYFVCGHRGGECRMFGVCAKQQFDYVIDRCVERHDRDAAQRIARLAMQSINAQRDVWCAVLNNVEQDQVDLNHECEVLKNQVTDLCDDLRFEEYLATLGPRNRAETYHYIDDSASLVHAFYIPTYRGEQMIIPIMMRLGRFVICFCEKSVNEVPNFLSPVSEQGRTITREIWNQVRALNLGTCSFTGSNAAPTQLVFLPNDLAPLMLNAQSKAKLLRTLDMDKKFIDQISVGQAHRFFFQRFGIDGFSMMDLNTILNTPICEGMSILQLQWVRAKGCLDHHFLPIVLIRQFLRNEYFAGERAMHPLARWFLCGETSICQLCYLRNTLQTHLTLIDTRMHDYGEDCVVRSARILSHGTSAEFAFPTLHDGEVVTRVGEHWVALKCANVKQAVITTLTLICKYLRSDGFDNPDARTAALFAIGRTFLYWMPTGFEMMTLFRCLAYIMFDRVYEEEFNLLDWCDLGEFLRIMLTPFDEGYTVRSYMRATLLRASIYACMLAKSHEVRATSHIHQVNVPPVEEIDVLNTGDGMIAGGSRNFGQYRMNITREYRSQITCPQFLPERFNQMD